MTTKEQHILNGLVALLDDMRNSKPADRSEIDRRYAVSITELEKLIAYFAQFVVGK